jgi:dTMP kinase
MFISLEGIDGCGKTTQARLLAEELGPEALSVREPGGTPAGEAIRAIVLDPATELGPRTELLLFLAARAELVEAVIRPALERGRAVVCDRFSDSTCAYQGGSGVADIESVEAMCDQATGGLWPDLTFLLRLDPELAWRRTRGGDRFEAGGLELQRGVAARYDEIARRHPDRVRVIDATGPIARVHERVMGELGTVAA